ncbi:MAG: hypothetical protein AAF360_03825 [Pseudomonadota bacterium]
MSEAAAAPFETADDGFERYYAEKLWSWIPEFYRTLDADPPNPGVLRAMIEIVASQAAVLRRDVDRVWDDQAIELCDEWAISYLGDLVGAFSLSEFNRRGNRLATARAVFYQRRKGSMGVMQELIRDVADLEGVVIEAFRRLVRLPHRLDIDAIGAGRVTETPVGGLIDLRSPRVKGLHDTAFDEGAHFADVRRLRGPYGRYGIRKVNFHLYPFRAFPLATPTPVEISPGRYTLDPSGRDAPLFQRGQTSDRPPDAVREVDLPDAILCRRFNASRHVLSAAALGSLNAPGVEAALAPLLGVAFRDAASFRSVIAGRLNPAEIASFTDELLDATLVADSEKAVLWGDSILLTVGDESASPALAPSAVIAAGLDFWEQGLPLDPFRALAFDPDTGRVVDGPARSDGDLFTDILHYGQFAPVGAGGYGRGGDLSDSVDTTFDGGALGPLGGFADPGPETVDLTGALPGPAPQVVRFATSKTYEATLPPGRVFAIEDDAVIEAADGTRPYLRFRPEEGALDVTFEAGDDEPSLTIDGLWIGMLAEAFEPQITASPAAPIAARLILAGDFGEVTLRNVTLDSGGERARNAPNEAVAIPFVRLEIAGQLERLRILRSIVGPIWETNEDPDFCNPGEIEICDSVVQAIDRVDIAIRTRLAPVKLIRSTVFGEVRVASLYADDSLVDGLVRVTDNQNGCFRYSATGDGDGLAVLPPQFEALVRPGDLPPHWFDNRRFGDPAYAALSKTAPEAVSRGASNGSEMGVFNRRGLAVLLDDLAAAVPQLMPVGQTPQYICERDQEDTR